MVILSSTKSTVFLSFCGWTQINLIHLSWSNDIRLQRKSQAALDFPNASAAQIKQQMELIQVLLKGNSSVFSMFGIKHEAS